MDARRPASVAARTAALLWLPLCAGLALWAARAPFGQPSLTTTMAAYGEVYAQVWDDFGFGRSLGVPLLGLTGDTVVDRLPYAHHPPIGWWPPYFGREWIGKTPLGFKFFPALWSCVALGLLAFLVQRHAGLGIAGGFALLLLSTPGFAAHAALPGVESFVLVAMVGFWLLEEGARRRISSIWSAAARCAYLAGTLVGWSFHFILIGLLISEALRPPAERRFRRIYGYGLLSALGIAIVFSHLAVALGGPLAVVQAWRSTLGNVVLGETVIGPDGPLTIGLGDTFGSMWARWHGALAGPLALLAGCGMLCVRSQRPMPVVRLGLALFLAGHLSIALFHGRSATHGYYWYLATPGQALILTAAAHGLIRAAVTKRTRITAIAALVGLLVVLTASSLRGGLPEIRAAYGQGGETLQLAAQAMTLTSKPDDLWLIPDHALQEAMVITPRRFLWTTELPRIEALLAARDRGALRMGRVLIAMVPSPRTGALLEFAQERIDAGRGRWLDAPGLQIAAL